MADLTVSVVVPGALGRDVAEMPLAENQQPSPARMTLGAGNLDGIGQI